MSRWFRRLLPSLGGFTLLGFVLVMGVGAATNPREGVSLMDGRQLHTFPDATREALSDGSWMTGVEAWSDDHVPSRRRWLNAHAGMSTQLMQDPLINNVYVGDESGLQLEALPDYRVPASLGDNAELLGEQVRAAGSQVLFVYVPRKEEVFVDRLPAGLRSSLPETRAQVLAAFARGGPVLDLTPALSVKSRRDGYFWRTDHHWTPTGALEALDQIAAKARSMGFVIAPDTRPYAAATYPDFYGSTARRATAAATHRPDRFVIPTPPKWQARSCSRGVCNRPTFVGRIAKADDQYTNRYAAFLGGDNGYQPLVNSAKKGDGTVLLLKDSLGNALATYLAERVEKVVTIDEREYGGAEIRDVVARDHPDLVIVMHNQATVLGNRQFDSRVWVDVKTAVAARRVGDG